MNIRRLPLAGARRFAVLAVLAVLMLATGTVRATSNYEYGADEYVTISNGVSPDGHLAITAHGGGDLGYEHFHLYLFDAVTGKKIGSLEEIAEILDTGAEAYGAKWNKDSTEVMIIYRRDRHVPLKAMTYRFAKGRAIPTTRQPVDIHDETLERFWQEHCGTASPSPTRTFGTPKHHS